MSAIRSYFARRPDPYAGGDLDNAQKIGSVLFGVTWLLVALLWPLSPPTKAIGQAGWIVAAVLLLAGFAVTLALRQLRIPSWTGLLAVSYGAIVALEILQWLGGGLAAPYERLLLLPTVFVAAIQPPRQIVVYLGFIALAFAAPFAYDGWDPQAAGGAVASLVVLPGLALGVNVLMTGVRAQRLAHARDEAEAREEARLDALTGLRNRRAFDEALIEDTKLARRLGIPLCVAMIDIVDFKQINDRWSLSQGDRCLREVAQALEASIREPDRCFRWGGDEFALILIGTAAGATDGLADRLMQAVSSGCRRPDEEPVEIRFAVAQLQEDDSPDELGEMAGLAMTARKMQTAPERRRLA